MKGRAFFLFVKGVKRKMKGDNTNQNYLDLVSRSIPKTHHFEKLWHAFWVGGVICSIGQAIRLIYENFLGLTGDELAGFVSMTLIFLSSFLTGLGVYDRIGKYAGGGSIVPITGFANSIVSPAMEFRAEGFIYGLAAKMFVISGPIIVFGIVSSIAVGFIYYFIYLVF